MPLIVSATAERLNRFLLTLHVASATCPVTKDDLRRRTVIHARQFTMKTNCVRTVFTNAPNQVPTARSSGNRGPDDEPVLPVVRPGSCSRPARGGQGNQRASGAADHRMADRVRR